MNAEDNKFSSSGTTEGARDALRATQVIHASDFCEKLSDGKMCVQCTKLAAIFKLVRAEAVAETKMSQADKLRDALLGALSTSIEEIGILQYKYVVVLEEREQAKLTIESLRKTLRELRELPP